MNDSAQTLQADLATNVADLRHASDLATGRIPAQLTDHAADVARRVHERRGLGADTTVVAFLGATGSGKSSLINAAVGERVVHVAATRPTTRQAHAVVVGDHRVDDVLDWLNVTERTQLAADQSAWRDLVLLDLPDIDSTETSHREIASALAQRVDALVWVLDPQKYADALIHYDYVAPMARHATVTVIVLNQIDTLNYRERLEILDDLKQLLASDGLDGHRLVMTSATTGEGIQTLRGQIAAVAQEGRVTRARLRADIATSAADMAAAAHVDLGGTAEISTMDVEAASPQMSQLTDAAVQVAGARQVEKIAVRSYRHRARRKLAWPPMRWLGKLSPDPLGRLGVRSNDEHRNPTAAVAALPAPGPGARAGLRSAVDALIERTTSHMPVSWSTAVRADMDFRIDQVSDNLPTVVASTDLGLETKPRWWSLVSFLQRLLLAVALIGGLWLLARVGSVFLALPEPPMAPLGAIPTPTLLLLGGVLGGLLLWWLTSMGARSASRRYAKQLRGRLDAGIEDCVDTGIVQPLVHHHAQHTDFATTVRRLAHGP